MRPKIPPGPVTLSRDQLQDLACLIQLHDSTRSAVSCMSEAFQIYGYLRELATVHENLTMVQRLCRRITRQRDRYVEILAGAFMHETGLPASRCELVQRIDSEGDISYYYREKESS